MRHYPSDSPRAAARIVVMSLIADGHISGKEIEALERRGFYRRLGLHSGELHEVVREVCEDLTQSSYLTWDEACRVDARVVEQLAKDVRDERIRREVLMLCETAVVADGHITCTEAIVLDAVKRAWLIH
ncbi:TerB family tellurite resistance protein [Caballeronia sp. LZ035]|uniref:tellurite resistance TerB family protein n=1 Tax=Caballeronia sp. LZ035 TaxID=3038568 RepID=UPI00285E2FE3|nr:TerB family tellurite resistance protein [Caballeronia sp. LZ035]MDR5761634.1 TerB family tellurite resistance protein [Caballeronia sp. LZ035]